MRRGLSNRMRWLTWAYATGWPRPPRSLESILRGMQSYDNLTLSVRKSTDGSRYDYGVTLYGRFFVVGGFPADGFTADLTEAAEAQGEAVSLPPTAEHMQ